MFKRKIISVVFVLFLFSLLYYFFIYSYEKENKQQFNKLKKEYKTVLFKDSLNSIVESTYYPEHWRGGGYSQYVTLKGGRKIDVYISRNLSGRENSFGDLIRRNALIVKARFSDTLKLVLPDSKEYLYLISNNNK